MKGRVHEPTGSCTRRGRFGLNFRAKWKQVSADESGATATPLSSSWRFSRFPRARRCRVCQAPRRQQGFKGMRRARPGNPRLAVAYLRVSTEEQRLGSDAQRRAIGEWASREAVDVLAWHADLGVGGGRELEDRPALVAALGELKVAGAGLLVVAKRDRLARDVAVASAVERAVLRCGARVVAADGAANGDGDADQFLRRILDAAAEYEHALIRARTKVALQAKRARGERIGTVPFGFAATTTGHLVPDPREQEILARVREFRAAGFSVRGITSECARLKLASRAGKPLSSTQIFRMLQRSDGKQ
jgi:DNA invertase Pin-like site-specific DNA recombinase